MKIFPRHFAKLFTTPVMIHAGVRHQLESALLSRMGLSTSSMESIPSKPRADIGDPGKPIDEWIAFEKKVAATQAQLRIENIFQRIGNVAVVSLDGVIDKHISQFEMDCYGGCDVADFDQALALAASDSKIEKVVLNINSPGGSVSGVPESAARVAELAKTKEVHAFVDVMACSAAYYIASQADVIAAAPSAILGSIGVYLTILDATRAAEMDGLKVELITAGKYKAMGSPFKPLADEERAMLQQSVTRLHADFRSAVKSGRRAATERGGHQTVADSAMEGQWFAGTQALDARLCDALTNQSLDEYVAALL